MWQCNYIPKNKKPLKRKFERINGISFFQHIYQHMWITIWHILPIGGACPLPYRKSYFPTLPIFQHAHSLPAFQSLHCLPTFWKLLIASRAFWQSCIAFRAFHSLQTFLYSRNICIAFRPIWSKHHFLLIHHAKIVLSIEHPNDWI